MKGTKQELFWKGRLGDEYTKRNKSSKLISSNLAFFSKVFVKIGRITSVLELGANIGLNLIAI